MSDPAGGLVLSLDFELAWGVLDVPGAEGPYKANLLGAREAIPRMLDLFAEFGVAATWATVGFLFAESREEREAYAPALRPAYANPRFDTYREPTGAGEGDDPTRFAPSLIRAISQAPRQRIGTHTHAHYYCLEAGQTPEAFDADLAAAVAIARARGVTLRSIVFPRHQVRADYLPLLTRHGIVAYRGNEPNGLDRPAPAPGGSLALRLVRRADAYLPLTGANAIPWSSVAPREGVVNVPASRFLRPYDPRLGAFDGLRLRRLHRAMRVAAERGALFHLWWHPHNLGVHQEVGFRHLRALLETFASLRDAYGFASYAMEDVAELASAANSRS
jgi:peptidoglycan/xylan/chitin deacetylase (PgdA/CDA1 family)